MERRYRLKKNKAFQYVYHRGHSVGCRNLVMLLAPGRELKIGFSVSKKTGNAVTRNKNRSVRDCRQTFSCRSRLRGSEEGCALSAEKAERTAEAFFRRRREPRRMKRFLLFLIRFYRREISHRKRKPSCRYIPTCSEYAVTAIERYGAWKGGRMALWRLLRCNPFSKGGYDPVPDDPCTTLRRE